VSESLNSDQIKELAAALWGARAELSAADDAMERHPSAASVSDVMRVIEPCPHGVSRGRWIRPAHGTPGCALCRLDYATALRARESGAAGS
jgi:hypothetical protein